MIQPIHVDSFYSDGRGPELVALRWALSGRVLEAAEFTLPDGGAAAELRHVRFLRPQVVMITPEEVIDYRAIGTYLGDHRPAAMFDLGKSEWLTSFAPQHLARCRHFQLFFYDELIDVIAEGAEFGMGPYQQKEPNQSPEPTSGTVTDRADARSAPVPPVAHH